MKKVFYAILVLIILYFVLALFGPNEVKTERTIIVNAPASFVREKLSDYRYFHEKWSPWTLKDPNMKVSYSGIAGQPGHSYEWDGEEVGKGTLDMLRFNGDSLVQQINFEYQDPALYYYIVSGQNGGSSNVKWGMHFDVDFIWRTPTMLFNLQRKIEEDFEAGLKRLKEQIETDHTASLIS